MMTNSGQGSTGERIDIGPTVNIVRLGSEATAGAHSVVEMRLPGGWAGPPAHRHTGVSHLWLVQEGAVELTVGDAVEVVNAGGGLHVPAGVFHAFNTVETDSATVVQIDTPGALDGYFRDLEAAFPPGTEVDPVVVREIMARHDTEPA